MDPQRFLRGDQLDILVGWLHKTRTNLPNCDQVGHAVEVVGNKLARHKTCSAIDAEDCGVTAEASLIFRHRGLPGFHQQRPCRGTFQVRIFEYARRRLDLESLGID
jgi:hypothetical protein